MSEKPRNRPVLIVYGDIYLCVVRRPMRSRLASAAHRSNVGVRAGDFWPVLEIEKGTSVELRPLSRTEFSLASSERTHLAFLDDKAGKVSGVALNPGPFPINRVKVN